MLVGYDTCDSSSDESDRSKGSLESSADENDLINPTDSLENPRNKNFLIEHKPGCSSAGENYTLKQISNYFTDENDLMSDMSKRSTNVNNTKAIVTDMSQSSSEGAYIEKSEGSENNFGSHSKRNDYGQGTSTSNERNSDFTIERFKNKFDGLRKRRLNEVTIPNPEFSKESSSNKVLSEKRKRDPMRKKKRKLTKQITELNACMPMSFKIFNDYDPHRKLKSNIEQQLNTAIAEKDYDLAEELNKEIICRNFATDIKGAMNARDYLKQKKKQDKKKANRKRKKLAWAFNAKERWETKGNM